MKKSRTAVPFSGYSRQRREPQSLDAQARIWKSALPQYVGRAADRRERLLPDPGEIVSLIFVRSQNHLQQKPGISTILSEHSH